MTITQFLVLASATLVAMVAAQPMQQGEACCLRSLQVPVGQVQGDVVLSGNNLNLFMGDQLSNGNNGSVLWLSRNASHAEAWLVRGRLTGDNKLPFSYKGYKIATSFNGKYVAFSGSYFRDDTLPRPLKGELWIFKRVGEKYEQVRYIYESSGGLGAGVGMSPDGTFLVASAIDSIATYRRMGEKWIRLSKSPAKGIGYGAEFFFIRGQTIFSAYKYGLTAFELKNNKWVADAKQSTNGVLDVGLVLDLSKDASTIAFSDDDYSDDETVYHLRFKCRQSGSQWRRCFNKQTLDYYKQGGVP